MHDDRHSKRADDQYQHFRVHFEIPVLIDLLSKRAIARFAHPVFLRDLKQYNQFM
jgi:hypothetical protein